MNRVRNRSTVRTSLVHTVSKESAILSPAEQKLCWILTHVRAEDSASLELSMFEMKILLQLPLRDIRVRSFRLQCSFMGNVRPRRSVQCILAQRKLGENQVSQARQHCRRSTLVECSAIESTKERDLVPLSD